jgi:pyruvate,water dikinase
MMTTSAAWLLTLVDAGTAREIVGGKAAVLGELADLGWPVPCGFVVTGSALADPDLSASLTAAAAECHATRFAVRSSSVAEDLPDASYAGLYETFLEVEVEGLPEAVRRCFAAAQAGRVLTYHQRRGSAGTRPAMAVLVQAMVDARAAGVAFTAHPVTGDREQTVVTAVAGLGEALVSGERVGEEWTATAGRRPVCTRQQTPEVLDQQRAAQVVELAARVAAHYDKPQDIEWAMDTGDRLWLLQARPMTALPDQPQSFTAPGPGLWMRNFRLGEWLPEAVTPLFGSWLLPELERGYLDGMQSCIGVRVPFRWALIHDWYYTAPPEVSTRLLSRVVLRGRARAVRTLFNALFRVGRDPVAADRAVLSGLYQRWRDEQLPRYRALVKAAEAELATANAVRVGELVTGIAREAGTYMWFLAVVGGSAWKIEAALDRFCRRHVGAALGDGGTQVLLRGLGAAPPDVAPQYAVQSLDWYHPVAAEMESIAIDHDELASRHRRLVAERETATAACRDALPSQPACLAEFDALLSVAQRYAQIREEQARDLTIGWPLLRDCARCLGAELVARGVVSDPGDLFFCTKPQVDAALAGHTALLSDAADRRRDRWERDRRLVAPVTIGRPPRLVGDVIDNAVRAARTGRPADDALVGHPASAGHATGPVRIVHGPEDFSAFRAGDVLVARATSPAWTPLFARAAAVVTDGGTLAAHASLVAREYGIPAVVGTGDATSRLRTGQIVTVDGAAGVVTTDTIEWGGG